LTGPLDKAGEERNRGLQRFGLETPSKVKAGKRNGRIVRRILMCRINEMKLPQFRALTGSYVSNVGVCYHNLCPSFIAVRFNDGA
jgi:hypothetical protein